LCFGHEEFHSNIIRIWHEEVKERPFKKYIPTVSIVLWSVFVRLCPAGGFSAVSTAVSFCYHFWLENFFIPLVVSGRC
jgi:hypothetical protein